MRRTQCDNMRQMNGLHEGWETWDGLIFYHATQDDLKRIKYKLTYLLLGCSMQYSEHRWLGATDEIAGENATHCIKLLVEGDKIKHTHDKIEPDVKLSLGLFQGIL